MLKTGAIGAALVAICCVTPVLPFVLAGLGLSGLIAVIYTDAVLFPALAFFTIFALLGARRRRSGGNDNS